MNETTFFLVISLCFGDVQMSWAHLVKCNLWEDAQVRPPQLLWEEKGFITWKKEIKFSEEIISFLVVWSSGGLKVKY